MKVTGRGYVCIRLVGRSFDVALPAILAGAATEDFDATGPDDARRTEVAGLTQADTDAQTGALRSRPIPAVGAWSNGVRHRVLGQWLPESERERV